MPKPASRGQRWSIEAAAGDFHVDRKTLKNRIRSLGIEPGEDNKFSTWDICRARFGDYSGQRLRKLTAEGDLLELELGKERKEMIPWKEVFSVYENVFTAVKMKILGSSLSETEQDKILNDLADLKNAEF